MEWTWSWGWLPINPEADFGDNLAFDWIRVVCVVLAMMLLMNIARVLVEHARREEPMPGTQIARFVSLGLATVSLALTEIAVVGTVATPRLLITVVCLVTGAWGVWGMRMKQKSMPIREDAR